jgi:hypothetical protein
MRKRMLGHPPHQKQGWHSLTPARLLSSYPHPLAFNDHLTPCHLFHRFSEVRSGRTLGLRLTRPAGTSRRAPLQAIQVRSGCPTKRYEPSPSTGLRQRRGEPGLGFAHSAVCAARRPRGARSWTAVPMVDRSDRDGLSGPGLDAAWSSGVTAAQDIHPSQRTKASHH